MATASWKACGLWPGIKGETDMIQLTKDLWLKADEHCYIVGKPVESRGKGTELRNPSISQPWRGPCLARSPRPCVRVWLMAVSPLCGSSSRSRHVYRPNLKS